MFSFPYRVLGSLFATLLISTTQPGHAAEPGQETVIKRPTQQRYEKLLLTVKQNPPATGAIICIGSSHMERWKTITNDLAPLRIYNYGVGGSRMAQAADLYILNLAIPYKPRAVILYEGSNDLAAGVNPDDIFQDFKRLCGKLHDALPETRLYVLGIVASPGKRFEKISDTKRTNDLLQKECELHSWMKFIDTTSPLIGADDLPKTECFIPNNVHMTPAGYAAWTAAIVPVVLPVERAFEK
jgi:lysophospholipase L1-like esterase